MQSCMFVPVDQSVCLVCLPLCLSVFSLSSPTASMLYSAQSNSWTLETKTLFITGGRDAPPVSLLPPPSMLQCVLPTTIDSRCESVFYVLHLSLFPLCLICCVYSTAAGSNLTVKRLCHSPSVSPLPMLQIVMCIRQQLNPTSQRLCYSLLFPPFRHVCFHSS